MTGWAGTRPWVWGLCLASAWAAPLWAADVAYDVRLASGGISPIIVVPGDTVAYEVTITVSTGDNDGLNFFSFDLETDLGVDQSVANTAFDPVVASAFTFLGGPFMGSVTGDDIFGFEGTQGFGTSGTTGIGQGQDPQVLASGTLITPTGVTGLFTVRIGPDTNTNLLDTGGTDAISVSDAETTIGPGFVIQTVAAGEDLDGDGVTNAEDNCPGDVNADQLDSDSDGLGDVCDSTPLGDDAGGDGDGDGNGGGDGGDGTDQDGATMPPIGNLWDLLSVLPLPNMAVGAGLFGISALVGAFFGGPLGILIGVVWGLMMASTAMVAGIGQ